MSRRTGRPYKRPMTWWWLSFADEKGFRGVSIVWAENTIVHAVREAKAKGCNPGPETSVAAFQLAGASPDPAYVNRLLTYEEAQFVDEALAAANRVLANLRGAL